MRAGTPTTKAYEMARTDDYEQGRQRFEGRPQRQRRISGLLVWAVIPAFLGLMALTNGAIGWAVALGAVAAVLALPGLIGWVTSDEPG